MLILTAFISVFTAFMEEQVFKDGSSAFLEVPFAISVHCYLHPASSL